MGDSVNVCGFDVAGLRKRLRLTQLELALKIGATPSAVYKWESGRSSPKLSFRRKLEDLAAGLGPGSV